MKEFHPPYPVPGVIWASLPLPALLVDLDGLITEANPAAEIFLNASVKTLRGLEMPVAEKIARRRASWLPTAKPQNEGA